MKTYSGAIDSGPVVSPTRPGTLYGLGLGPGDPELVTLKALRIMRTVPTLFIPVRRVSDPGYAWTIAEPHLEPGRQCVVRLPFPQGLDHDELDAQWDQNCRRIQERMADGQDAAFLTEGDPLLYGSFVHVAARLRLSAPHLALEVVPGVSSITAAAAAAGLALASRGGRLAVLPAFEEPALLSQTLRDFDTVVLLKVNRVLEPLRSLLKDLGLADGAVLVERCGRPEQRVLRLADWPASVDYFSLVIVSGAMDTRT